MRSTRLLLVSMAAAIALSGCNKARQLPAAPNPARGCTDCHGGEQNLTGAPPWSLPRLPNGTISAQGNRLDATANLTQIAVGAHTAHMGKGVACGSCHVVPARIDSPNHNVAQRATVTFGGLAAAANVVPSAWVPAVHTCTNYCHGASLAFGGPVPAPDWLAGPAGAACGSCHFAANTPPYPGHPTGPNANGSFPTTSACAICHTETVNTDGTINYASGTHVNGQLDGGGGHPANWADPANHGPAGNAGLQNCATCHGANFDGGSVGVSCTACHATNGHPYWQAECTFCHGDPARAADAAFPLVPASLPAGANSSLQVRANLAGPPQGTQNEAATNTYAVGAHQAHTVDGTLARAAQCSECHGPALPVDVAHVNGTVAIAWGVTAGNGVTPTPAAGNLARWNDATMVPPNCTNFCHGATLAGGLKTSVKWTEGATGAACGSCHAIPLPYTAAGQWHVQRQDCGTCHPGYTSTTVNVGDHVYVGAGPQGLTCTSCHGSANAAPPSDTAGNATGVKVGAHQRHLATALTAAPLGCDECHATVAPGNFRHANGVVNMNWLLGATTPATPSPTAGALPAGWEAAPTCTNYCHGQFVGGNAAAVNWTSTTAMTCNSCHGRSAGAVATPPTNHGAGDTDCGSCHTGYTPTTVNTANHLNGSVQVLITGCTACHGDATRSPVASATDLDAFSKNLVLAAPPRDSAGGAPTSNQIGAHQAHVNQGATAPALSNALRCVNCHNGLVPVTAPHTPYPANPVAFGNLATAAAASPNAYSTANRNCSNTYCHGQFTGGKPGNTVNWGDGTPAKLACNACHGQSAAAPQPGYPHPQNTGCADCHAGATSTTVAAASHVNGAVDKTTAGCTACHGERADLAVTLTTNTFKSAPGATNTLTSEDTTGGTLTSAFGVGAHRAHLVGAGGTPRWRSAAIACTECHLLPATNADTSHATGVGTGGARATVAWGNLAQDNAFETKAATYVQATGCTATYCHDPKSADTAAGQVNLPSWTGATAQAQCGSCHGLPPVTPAHPANTACSSCHPGYGDAPTSASTIAAVNALAHLNGQLDGGGDCTGCHASAQAITQGPLAGTGTRRAITPEFALTWSHKRSAGGTVTKYDCGVCHLEGDAATGNTTGFHQDGYVNLRDPDLGTQIANVAFSPASGNSVTGAYGPAAGNAAFAQFSRNLSVTLEADANFTVLASIMVNHCLKCHDAGGAASTLAQVPTSQMPGASPYKPFGTNVAYANVVYTGGPGLTAGNVAGGVIDVNESFKTTNSSYHPVSGKQNNSYAANNRMAAPWVNTKTAGTLTGWGPLISCWDCHAAPTDSGTITRSVTAHGATNTLRGTPAVFGTVSTTNAVTLCRVCHAGYDTNTGSNHGTNSAFNSSTDSGMTTYLRYGCNWCHSSSTSTTATAPRPVRAQDVHGVNALPAAGTKSGRWSGASTGTPAQVEARPYAFIRNTVTLANHQPARIGGSTYSASCSTPASGSRYTTCNNGMNTYSAGGTY